MRTYNICPTRDKYYSQLNNEIAGKVTCKPTATIASLAIAGWTLPTGKYPQPEDNLTFWCRSPDGLQVQKDIDPQQMGNPPNESWPIIAHAINKVFYPTEKPLIGPRWNWDLREVLFGITQGVPFAASTYLTKYGHVVTLVGFETSQEEDLASWKMLDLSKVTGIIINDPFGNRLSGAYTSDKNGFNNKYPMDVWMTVWRSTGIQIKKKA